MAKAPADIRSLARSHTDTALKVLAAVMSDRTAPGAARVAAANSLLDRGWGKPLTTSVTFSAGNINELSDQELLALLVELRASDKSIDNVEQSSPKALITH